MILNFRREVYGIGDRYYIYDENWERKYYVKGSSVLFSQKFEICDLSKKKVLVTIKNEPKSLVKKKHYVYVGNEKVATLTKEFPSLTTKYIIEGLNWEKRGVMRTSYEMLENGKRVFSMDTEGTDWGITPVLRIEDGVDELTALGVAMVITYVNAVNQDDDENNTEYL